jgi:microsomal dipeptidase-like Zn-dependent dipeptidase
MIQFATLELVRGMVPIWMEISNPNYRQLPDWVTELRAKGLSEPDLAKVVGGNALRILDQMLKPS